MRIERAETFGFEHALRGMRNPLDSWDKSDSIRFDYSDGNFYDLTNERVMEDGYEVEDHGYEENYEMFLLGDKDKDLAQRLTNAGSEHCKFLRQIQVWVDLTLPRYIWSEFDTYKFNTKNSCSTMHTAHKRELTTDDFEGFVLPSTLEYLNDLIKLRKGKDITSEYFIVAFKQNLPESFLQMRTVNTNYAELLNILKQRRKHRLSEWHEICDWILSLPYFKQLTGIEKGE